MRLEFLPRRASALLLAVLLIPACGGGGENAGGTGTPADPPFVPLAIFSSDLNTVNLNELFGTDGAGRVRLLSGTMRPGGFVRGFSWSPDRRWVAFLADKETGRIDLYIVPASGGEVRNVHLPFVLQGDVIDFAWAPDSSRIAYRGGLLTGAYPELFTAVPYDPSTAVKVSGALTPNGSVSGSLAGNTFEWAPDSSRIAYLADQDTFTRTELYTSLAAGGGNAKVSVSGTDDVFLFSWSPDSQHLAYTFMFSPYTHFALHTTGPSSTAMDATVATDLLNNVNFSMGWAPGGARVAFRRDIAGATKLFTALADGTSVAEVSGPLAAGRAVLSFYWSPDGTKIAYAANQDVSTLNELYVSLAATAIGNVKVSGALQPGGFVDAPAWAPDGSRIAYIAVQDSSGRKNLYTSPPSSAAGNVCVSDRSITGQDVLSYAWSPDSARLALRGALNDMSFVELFTAVPTATGVTRVSGPLVSAGMVVSYRWTADSNHLVYEADQDRDQQYDLYLSPATSEIGNVRIAGPHFANAWTFLFDVK